MCGHLKIIWKLNYYGKEWYEQISSVLKCMKSFDIIIAVPNTN